MSSVIESRSLWKHHARCSLDHEKVSDEYLRLGYCIGSGAVESAHKQVVHARFRQAGMRWSEAGARRLLALRLLLLNDNWALLDRLRMVSLA